MGGCVSICIFERVDGYSGELAGDAEVYEGDLRGGELGEGGGSGMIVILFDMIILTCLLRCGVICLGSNMSIVE